MDVPLNVTVTAELSVVLFAALACIVNCSLAVKGFALFTKPVISVLPDVYL